MYFNFLNFFTQNKQFNILNYINNIKDFYWLWGNLLNNFIFNVFILIVLIYLFMLNLKTINYTLLLIYVMYNLNLNINASYNNFYSIINLINNNASLTNGLVNVHPNIILLTNSFIIFILLLNCLNFKKYNIYYLNNLFKIWFHKLYYFLIFGLFLGSWWSSQELNWGGWWNWDPVEFSGFILLTFIISLVHISKNKLNHIKFKYLIIIVIFLNFLTTRMDLLNSIHNFILNSFTQNNINYVLFILLISFFFFKNLNYKNFKNNFFMEVIFKKIIFVTIFTIICLILLNFANQLDNEQILGIFKKIILFIMLLYIYNNLVIFINIKIIVILMVGFIFNYYYIHLTYLILNISNHNSLFKVHKFFFISVLLVNVYVDYKSYLFIKNTPLVSSFIFNFNIDSFNRESILSYNLFNSNYFNFFTKNNNNEFSFLEYISKFEFFNYKNQYSIYFEDFLKNNFYLNINNNLILVLLILVRSFFIKNINLKFY